MMCTSSTDEIYTCQAQATTIMVLETSQHNNNKPLLKYTMEIILGFVNDGKNSLWDSKCIQYDVGHAHGLQDIHIHRYTGLLRIDSDPTISYAGETGRRITMTITSFSH